MNFIYHVCVELIVAGMVVSVGVCVCVCVCVCALFSCGMA